MPVALAQSGYCPEGCESRRGQAEEGKKWVTILSAAFALLPIDGSPSSGHSSLVQAQELVLGFLVSWGCLGYIVNDYISQLWFVPR